MFQPILIPAHTTINQNRAGQKTTLPIPTQTEKQPQNKKPNSPQHTVDGTNTNHSSPQNKKQTPTNPHPF
jgi:hypothetical protein